ncbi:MAG TPA: DUF3048 domain-containing protein [Clostridia bacterium]|nr:DUF3048 domain-containing protein [Clostridia bacterium]
MYRRSSILLASLIITMAFSACSPQPKEETQPTVREVTPAAPEKTPAETTTPGIIETEPVDQAAKDDIYSLPMTGVRPVAVMVDNQGSRVLPQGGLDKAQIVYEVIVEGGLTRLMPVFWGTMPEMIGPVRSARDYFLDYVLEYDAIYVHVGGSPQAVADIRRLGTNDIDGMHVGKDVIWDLTKDRGNWQDSYTSMTKLLEYAETRKYKTTTGVKFPFSYNETDVIPTGGQAAVKLTFKYPSMTSGYEYDSAAGTYKRIRQGVAHMERVSGKQLEAKNIIVQYVRNYDIKDDTKGRQEMGTVGSGKGWFITCGKAVELTWSKKDEASQTQYKDGAGNPIALNRGQTWIQMMPLTGKVTIE